MEWMNDTKPLDTTSPHPQNDSIFLEARDASGRSDAAGAETGNFTVAVGRPIKDETEYRQVCI